MDFTAHLTLIISAWLLDLCWGDPEYRLHPIRLLGAWIRFWENVIFGLKISGRGGGIIHWLLTVGGALTGWWMIHRELQIIQQFIFMKIWDIWIAYSLLCTRDLLTQGLRVHATLDDLPRARQQLSNLVGRDTKCLNRAGVVRATIESLAENFTDGVLTPWLALCLFGLPGIIIIKAVSTLDSMIGYRTERYQKFGWAAARSDDLTNWLPARLSSLIITGSAALWDFYPRLAWHAAWKYHALLPSPNSGWSEAACAGALKIRLVGPIYHHGILITKDYLGDPAWPSELNHQDLKRAVLLISGAAGLAFIIGLALVPLRILFPW